MLIAGATFTDLGAANHGNRSEVDFQESYNIHVGSTVVMMQVRPHKAQASMQAAWQATSYNRPAVLLAYAEPSVRPRLETHYCISTLNA